MTSTPQEPWQDPNQPFGPPQPQPQQPGSPGGRQQPPQPGGQQQPPPQGWQQPPAQGWQPPPPQQGWQQQPGPQGWGGPGYDPMARSRVLAGVLGILLGALGVHNFYTGYNQFAWIQLGSTVGSVILTVITLGLFAPVSSVVIPGMAVWGLVEGIMFLTQRTGRYSMDAWGRPLRD